MITNKYLLLPFKAALIPLLFLSLARAERPDICGPYYWSRYVIPKDILAIENPDQTCGDFYLIHLAAQYAPTLVVNTLIHRVSNLEAADALQGNTALHYLTRYERIYLMDSLINRGADINTPNRMGYTPLHVAAFYGKENSLRYLLEKGADFNASSNNGEASIHLAATGESLRTLVLLYRKGVGINFRNPINGKTPLHYALSHKRAQR